jgi:dipeptidyl aminopeptidase/acylaminoacyl peptidase
MRVLIQLLHLQKWDMQFFVPNPRGSSGYGTEFRQANRSDWGGKDFIDLMAGVDEVIKMGVADENKMGVMGWSYGGFMSSLDRWTH